MLLKLDSKRRLTIPVKLAPFTPGDIFEAHYDEDEDVLIYTRVKGAGKWLDMRNRGEQSKDEIPRRKKKLTKKVRR